MLKKATPSKSTRTPRKLARKPSDTKENAVNEADDTSKGSKSPSSPYTSTAIQVVVRLRPINEREKTHGTLPVVTASSQDKTVTVVRGSGRRQARSSYAFDNVFSAFTTQEEVFDSTLRPILRDVMLGYESTVFAYGQTGTGKTHTMEGDLSSPEQHGVIPRAARSIFETLSRPEYKSHTVTVSCLEIYNEELCDLFATEEQRKGTKVEIMEGKDGICCRGQVQVVVNSADDVLQLMRKAQDSRMIGETKMNKQSSRSHCIFTLQVNAHSIINDGNTLEIHGKLHLVDLAGSECAKTASGKGIAVKRERERSNINRSLLTLGRVILMLKEQCESGKKSSNVRIPYRDSKLTRLLQKSLGGKCKTLVIATLSPSVVSIEESVSTLNYAQSANGIVNKPVATSYLSINTKGGVPNGSIDPSGGEGGQSLEHWYEMECRLQYMETQVQEAQAALARNHMVQQEITDRAVKAEKALCYIEEKYEEAAIEVRKLNENAKVELAKKAALTLELADTQLTLKKTSAILNATADNEVTLTAEGNALIKTLEGSLDDGETLYKSLLDTREADVERRLATRKFHAATVSVLDNIMTTLNELQKKEEVYSKATIDSAGKENSINHASLNLSIELVKDINSRVKELTATIKSYAQDENGVLPLLSKITEDIKGDVLLSKGILKDGEAVLSSSISMAQKQLEDQCVNLKQMDVEYTQFTDKLLTTLDSNSTESRSKIVEMVSSVNSALSDVTGANSETRTALNTVISEMDNKSREAAVHMEVVSKGQSVAMNNAIDTFADGMKYIGNMKSELNKQIEFINQEGSEHVNTIDTQKTMLTSHHGSILKAKDEQLAMKEQFLATVLDGVKDLVNKQMDLYSNKHQEHLSEFKEGTERILGKNTVIGSSADSIIKEVSQVNQSLTNHAEEADNNDMEMKVVAEGAKVAFVDVCDSSKSQQLSIETYTNQSNRHMNDLSTQSETVGDICETMHTKKDVVVECVNKMIQDEKNSVSELTVASKKRAEYTSNTVITSVSSNLKEMERPRNEVVSNIATKLDCVTNTVSEGQANIEAVAKQQSAVANELKDDIEMKYNDHNNRIALQAKAEFDVCLDSTLQKSRGHLEDSIADLSSSVGYVSTTHSNIHNFAETTMEYEEEVPPIRKRTKFSYSPELSATPSAEIILQGM